MIFFFGCDATSNGVSKGNVYYSNPPTLIIYPIFKKKKKSCNFDNGRSLFMPHIKKKKNSHYIIDTLKLEMKL